MTAMFVVDARLTFEMLDLVGQNPAATHSKLAQQVGRFAVERKIPRCAAVKDQTAEPLRDKYQGLADRCHAGCSRSQNSGPKLWPNIAPQGTCDLENLANPDAARGPGTLLLRGFEIKWDGIRTLAAVEALGWRLWGRQQADYTQRYPELKVLRHLPARTLVHGELVACHADGRPDLPRLLRRHGLIDPWCIRHARHWCPVRYVLFDVLYHAGRCFLREPLARRRAVLAEVCQRLAAASVLFSEAVVAHGHALYAAALAQGYEGVLAKHLASSYRPGQRCAAWRKIKPHSQGSRSAREVFSY